MMLTNSRAEMAASRAMRRITSRMGVTLSATRRRSNTLLEVNPPRAAQATQYCTSRNSELLHSDWSQAGSIKTANKAIIKEAQAAAVNRQPRPVQMEVGHHSKPQECDARHCQNQESRLHHPKPSFLRDFLLRGGRCAPAAALAVVGGAHWLRACTVACVAHAIAASAAKRCQWFRPVLK